jgi:hypothetical protein
MIIQKGTLDFIIKKSPSGNTNIYYNDSNYLWIIPTFKKDYNNIF